MTDQPGFAWMRAARRAGLSRRALLGASAGAAAAVGARLRGRADARDAETADAPGPLRVAGMGGPGAPLPETLLSGWAETGRDRPAPAEDAATADILVLPHDLAGADDLPPLRPLPAADGPFAALEADWSGCWRAGGMQLLGLALPADAAPREDAVGGEARAILFAAALELEEDGVLPPGAAIAAHRDPAMAETVFAALEAALPRRRLLSVTEAAALGAPSVCTARAAAAAQPRPGAVSFDLPLGGVPARLMGFAIPAAAPRPAQAAAFIAWAAAQAEADWSGGDVVLMDEALAELHPMPPESLAHAARRRAAEARLFA
ncbi:hypothetical protein ACQ5SO_08395 [Rhodovulum sp. DZ06]|uniref:hypothetical protein n=1 Tax=Rhodovulum sp. DZ06 TaxID=3425126 RepID=UPI003D35541A